MAMSALVSKNFFCGPGWGRKRSFSGPCPGFGRSPPPPVVWDFVLGEDDGLGVLRFDPAGGMGGPPVTLGHRLGPGRGAEGCCGTQREARLSPPPGLRLSV